MSSVTEHKLGFELLDRVSRTITADKVIGENANPDGLIRSLTHGQFGDHLDTIGAYDPGSDSPHNIDIVNSLANDRFYANKILDTANPLRINVILDTPLRTAYLEGHKSLPWLAAFTLASAIRIGELSGNAKIRVLNTASKNGNGVVFDGSSKEAQAAFSVMSSPNSNRTSTLAEMVSFVNNDLGDEDATIVVSDFMDGYDLKSNTFSWESAIKNLSSRKEDLIRILRVSSISHMRIPHYAVDGLESVDTVDSMNAAYAGVAKAKEARIRGVFRNLTARALKVDTAMEKPSLEVIRLLEG
jgi:hypothetical protein